MFSTPDELYLDGEKYLIEKSFLSFFYGYRILYPNVEITEVLKGYGTSGGPNGLNYYPVWLLQDSILYLREISFYHKNSYVKKIFPEMEQYKLMEKLTGQKFQKDNDALNEIEPKSSGLGSMKACWVEGVFYAKKARKTNESIDLWEQLSYRKIVFKAGKLVSIDKVEARDLRVK